VIVEVAVKPGDQVRVGDTLCVLEAMKMKNAIRAPRAGQIATVFVQIGQAVKHHDSLVAFTD
jgi:biotin carboxyl carrier protein